MKLIKITTENQISVHDFPEGTTKKEIPCGVADVIVGKKWILLVIR